jgi:predicted transposase/invertase (TIGR01784 family)
MRFLDPTIDIVFKKLFGTVVHKDILIHFLNSVLGREEGNLIVDVVFNDLTNIPETLELKESIVDVRCTDQSKHQYIIEMQVSPQKDYAQRAQYYSALALSRQLEKSEKYEKLVPVIFIGILDFSLFACKEYISKHSILNTKTYENELTNLQFYFIELSKFDIKIEKIESILDKWIYFLKHASQLRKIPESYQKQVVFDNAFRALEEGSWSRGELEAYDRYLDAIRSRASQLETALEMGMEKGIQKGMEKGIKKGIKEGIKEGELRKALEVARELVNFHDTKTIARITGLSEAQIEELKRRA